MKKYVIAALAVIMLVATGAGTASAANSLKQGTIGFGVDVNEDFMITGKYFARNDLALLAGFGLGIKGGDADGTDIGLLLGVRKYLKNEDFAPFVGAFVEYKDTNYANDVDQKDLGLLAQFGAEYFLHKQFSIEGSIAAGYKSTENDTPAGNTKVSSFGTDRATISFNFYF